MRQPQNQSIQPATASWPGLSLCAESRAVSGLARIVGCPPDCLPPTVRGKHLEKFLGVSRWTLLRRVQSGAFPSPLPALGQRPSREWATNQIIDWARDPAGYVSRTRAKRAYTPRKTR